VLNAATVRRDRSRLRIEISAQRGKTKASYDGQILTDSGSNEIMLDNGPVSCKAGA
jgi:hypothetical protein